MNERALKVLEQYELEVGQLRRGRGSYMFDTPQGLRMLCDCTCSEHKAEFQNRVMERMREGGYQRVDRIVQNREGKAGFRGSGWQSLSGAGVVCGKRV